MSAGVLAGLAALAVLVVPVVPGVPGVPGPGMRHPPRARLVARERRGVRVRSGRPAAAAAAAVGVLALVGGAGGAVLGAVVGMAVWIVVGRLEPAGVRRRREDLERQAPLTIDLVAACLASGATLEASAAAAADAVGSPTADLLEAAVAAQRLGAAAADAWSEVARHDALAPLARAVIRAHDSGAPVSDVLARAAARARARHRARAEARVRTAAVRLTGPLGLAFLPAFVLLGVVPVVASWIGSVL